MSDIAKELRELVRTLAREKLDANTVTDWREVWGLLAEVGITEVGTDRTNSDVEDLGVCVEEIAAAGLSAPLIENALAAWAAGGTPDLAVLRTVAVVGRSLEVEAGTVSARLADVAWANEATQLLVVGPTGHPLMVDISEADVESCTPNLAGEPTAVLVLRQAPVVALTDVTNEEVMTRLRLLRSSALLATARAAYDLTKTYVTTREQFGAPLVRVPAVANNLALMRIELIGAQAGLDRAHQVPDAERDVAAQVARLMCARGASRVGSIAHQLHGAMGVTEEYSLHRLTRRIWAWRDADVSEHLEAQLLGRIALASGEDRLWKELTA